MENEKKEYGRVPIELIDAGPEIVRTRKVEKGIEELAENIKRVGLIHPLKVYKKEGRYRLLVGQRRLMALKKLGWKKAPVTFADGPKDSIEAVKLSLSENLPSLRHDLTKPDMADAVERLLTKYESTGVVAEELGISEREVSEVLGLIKIEKNAPKVAEDVKKKKIDEPQVHWIDYGKMAVDATIRPDNIVDEEKALKLLPEIRLLPKAAQRKRLVEFARRNPEATVEEIVEEAKKPQRIIRKAWDISTDLVERLTKASEAEDKDEDVLVELALTEWLSRKGY